MSQQQRIILDTIAEIHRSTYAPARTVAIAQRCYFSERTARYQLVALERAGLVRRVGARCGWLPVAA